MYQRYFKRFLDLILAIFFLILLAPVMIIVFFLIIIKMRTNPLFSQRRVGLNNEVFTIYKFKTMSDKRDSLGSLLSDNERLTSFGRFLRSLSVDELPQLYNILVGDMSLVGPRPLLVSYLPLYTPNQSLRHTVRPGVTGWAQVNGRNALDWNTKFDLDVWYTKNLTFLLDVKILLKTLLKVLARDGISSSTTATMEPFRGNKDYKSFDSSARH